MDEVRSVLRRLHYSIHTERAYCYWIKRYVVSHKMTSRAELLEESETKIEAFLTHLVVDTDVASSTQNQAMKALVFLCKKVLKQPLNQEINATRAAGKTNVPVVLTHQEVASILALMEGTPQLVTKVLYGSMEAVRLRAGYRL